MSGTDILGLSVDLSGLERLQQMLAHDLRPPMAKVLGVRITEVAEGHVLLESTPTRDFYNPLGVVHGGFAATVLDFACGYSVLSKCAPGQRFTTLEIKVAYHRAITEETGPVRCAGQAVKVGRRVAYAQAHLNDVEGDLLASATSTLIVVPR